MGYLAQRTDLVQQLQLVHPEAPSPVFKKTAGKKVGDWEIEGVAACDIHVTGEEEQEWTAWDICDGMEVYSLYSCRYSYWCIVLYTNYKLPVCLLSHLLAWAIKRATTPHEQLVQTRTEQVGVVSHSKIGDVMHITCYS